MTNSNNKFEGKFSKPAIALGLLVVALLLFSLKHSFDLRRIGYDQVPETFVILDERTLVWQGLSIRSSGIPAGWSNIENYKTGPLGDVLGFNVEIDDVSPTLSNWKNFPKPARALKTLDFGRGAEYINFVQPYFDNPPLGGLIMSVFVSNNVKKFTDLTPAEFRKASLWEAVLTGVLIFLLGLQIFKNVWISLMAAVIYGSVPTFLLLSRYALLENTLAPLSLLVLNLLVFGSSIKKNKALLIVLGGIFAGLCALTKETGWSMFLVGLFLIWYWKLERKYYVLFGVPAILIGSLYFIWGLYLDPKLFSEILLYHSSNRPFIGSINFLVALFKVSILNFPLDGWWTGGFLALILVPFKKEFMPLFAGAAGSLLAALFLGSANYPWYFITVIPFMCLAIAYFLWQVATNPKFYSIMILFLVFFSSSFYWGYGVFKASFASTNYQQPVQVYRLIFLFFLSCAIGLTFFPKLQKYKFVWPLMMVLFGIWMLVLNDRSFLYILGHWGKLPSLYTPGTF